MSVNKNRLQLALDALRSGEFQQCSRALARRDAEGNVSYCCLGVMTEVAIRNGLELEASTSKAITDDTITGKEILGYTYPADLGTISYCVEYSVLHPAVQQWYGIEFPNPNLIVEDPNLNSIMAAAELNDSYGWNFNQIADAFEATFMGDA